MGSDQGQTPRTSSGSEPAGTRRRAARRTKRTIRERDLGAPLPEVARAVDLVKEAPEIREEKVEALRRAIRDGRYAPSAEALAAKLLGLPPESPT